VRKKATQAERLAGKTKLSKYEDLDVPLDADQSVELCDIIKSIKETRPAE